MPREKRLHVGRFRVLDAQAQTPVIGPRLERVARERRGIARKLVRVAGAECGVRAEHASSFACAAVATSAAHSEYYSQETPINHALSIAREMDPARAENLAQVRARRGCWPRARRSTSSRWKRCRRTDRRPPRARLPRAEGNRLRLLLADPQRVRRAPPGKNAARGGCVDRAAGGGGAEDAARVPRMASRRGARPGAARHPLPGRLARSGAARGAAADERLGRAGLSPGLRRRFLRPHAREPCKSGRW